MNLKPDFIPHEKFHKGSWFKADNSSWYYFGEGDENDGEIKNGWFDNTLDPEIKSLVKFFHKNNIRTSPSCAGHFFKPSYFKNIWNGLKAEEEKINSHGIELFDSENNKKVVFKDRNYKLPWSEDEFIKKALKYQKKGVLGIFKDSTSKSIINGFKKIKIPNVSIKDVDGVILFIINSNSKEEMEQLWDDLTDECKSVLKSFSETRSIVKKEIKKLFESDYYDTFPDFLDPQYNPQIGAYPPVGITNYGTMMKEEDNSSKMIGYKVMRYENGEIISGANSRLKFKPEVGKYIKMPGQGVFLSPIKQYVLDYYSDLNDVEALLTLEFDVNDIVFGDIEDREPELGVSKVKLIDIEILE